MLFMEIPWDAEHKKVCIRWRSAFSVSRKHVHPFLEIRYSTWYSLLRKWRIIGRIAAAWLRRPTVCSICLVLTRFLVRRSWMASDHGSYLSLGREMMSCLVLRSHPRTVFVSASLASAFNLLNDARIVELCLAASFMFSNTNWRGLKVAGT